MSAVLWLGRICGGSWRRPFGALLGIILLLAYVKLLDDHGTFSPAVLFVTFPYTSPPAAQAPSSQRRGRVVVSLSTMPTDINRLQAVLQTLRAQSVPPDVIHINIPDTNRRTGQAYHIPSWLNNYSGVQLNRGLDYGPITKLLPAIAAEPDPDTLIITVDDDKVYPSIMIETLLKHVQRDPSVAWGICGWAFMPFFPPRRIIPATVPYYLRGSYGRGVQVLQGVCGVAYRRSFFGPDAKVLETPSPECYTSDDMWISGYLNARHIPRVLVPGPVYGMLTLEPQDTEWLSTSRQYRLSNVNTVAGKDYACYASVERELGPWQK